MRTTRPRTLEPDEQLEAVLNEIAEKVAALAADLARLEWLRLKTAEHIAELRTNAEAFAVFTEKEAAKQLKIGERALADLRRTHGLPHVIAGSKPRYTTEHLREICQILESRPRGRAALKIAA